MKNLENRSENIENLIHAYLSGVISQEEKDELFTWLSQNPENVNLFNQISNIWLSASVFQDNQNFEENEAFDRVKAKINFVNTSLTSSKKEFRLTWIKVAAVLIPAMIISGLASKFIWGNKTTYSETPFVFEVPFGSKATLILPDSSRVILNAGSKLSCKEGFGKTHRMLRLVGEGYFTVAKNKDLPFVVNAGSLNVRALGTEFNVKAYPDDKNIEAILIHGSIQINKTSTGGNNEKPLVLLPKQSLIYSKQSDHFQINIAVNKDEKVAEKKLPVSVAPKVEISKTTIDPIIYTTWKEGSWIIFQKELSMLAIELERKYDVNIHFGNESLKKIKVTGTLPDISLEQVLAAIRLISPIEYKIKGKDVELIEDKNLTPIYNKYYRNSDTN